MLKTTIAAALVLAAHTAAPAQALRDGYFCCNMQTDGGWLNDINYADNGQQLQPLGTPVKIKRFGVRRLYLEVGGKEMQFGNDYSRTMNLNQFAARYIVAEDPRLKLSTFEPKVRAAVQAGRLMRGMTKEQALMTVAYPVTSENPTLDAPVWHYWTSTWNAFDLLWGDDGKLRDVTGDPRTLRLVLEE